MTMERTVASFLTTLFAMAASCWAQAEIGDQAWISLFDGKTLAGWKASENKDSFSLRDGMIVAHGPRSHLFYVGPAADANFKDFELKVDIKTSPGSNGGVYFHTEYAEKGWPEKGFEVQVNNSYHQDPRKTGSLYGIVDVAESPAKDGVWFTEHIIVQGKHVSIEVDGKKVVDWTQLEGQAAGRSLSAGTFALQGHDPNSTVCYKNIFVKPLPVIEFPLVDYHVHLKGGLTLNDAIELSKQRGVKFGIAQNCGIGFNVTNDEGARRFLLELAGKPVYRAMQAEGREWLRMFSPEVIAQFDYVFTDAMTFTDKGGKRIRLWINDEVQIGEKQEFMDMYVDKIIGILNKEPIDIYVNPTFLPALIAKEYDSLWTDDRMDKVIRSAVKNGVAIEINATYRLPSAKFIKKAKQAGVKFAFGTNNGGRELGNLEYCRRMAIECGLTKDDIFVPKPDGMKPIQRRKVAQ